MYRLILFLLTFPSMVASEAFVVKDRGPYAGSVCAFADMNFDRYTDVVVVRRNGTSWSVAVLLAPQTEDAHFKESPTLRAHLADATGVVGTPSCSVADFNGDSFPDLLVSFPLETGVLTELCFGNRHNTFNCSASALPFNATVTGEMLSVDINGNGVTDLIGPSTDGKLLCAMWYKTSLIECPKEKVSSSMLIDKKTLSTEFSHAFVDLNGDLNADLLLAFKDEGSALPLLAAFQQQPMDKATEYKWVPMKYADGKAYFPAIKPNVTISGAEFIGHPSLGDFDADRYIDVVLPMISEDEKTLHLFMWSYQNKRWNETRVDLSNPKSPSTPWKVFRNKRDKFHLRVGDFDLDGYPDMIVVLENGKTRQAFLIHNELCSPGALLAIKKCTGGGFRIQWSVDWSKILEPDTPTADSSLLNQTKKKKQNSNEPNLQPVLATFFDLFEDGMLDVITQFDEYTASSEGKPGTTESTFYFRTVKDKGDTTFLKATVCTATCSTNCPNKQNEGSGIAAPGAAVFYSSDDGQGGLMESSHTQLSQTSHRSLQLPFSLFGLGRSPNFVDKMEVGVPWLNYANCTWKQIVPNSRLYIVPGVNGSDWLSRLYITPSRLIWLSLATLGCVCAVILVLVAFFQWREMREDRLERREERHKFHFDAM